MNHKRLLDLYDSATPAQLASGLGWYRDARVLAEQLASRSGHSVDTMAAVIAALSPQVRWSLNGKLAAMAVERWENGDKTPLPCLGRNSAKAYRLLDGERPLDVLGGAKVLAFYANIVGDSNAVTVDVWAARAIASKQIRKRENDFVNRAGWITRNNAAIQAAYRRASALRGVTPRDFQAVVWTVIRGKAD